MQLNVDKVKDENEEEEVEVVERDCNVKIDEDVRRNEEKHHHGQALVRPAAGVVVSRLINLRSRSVSAGLPLTGCTGHDIVCVFCQWSAR